MAVTVKWTNEARITFDKNIAWLLKEWSEKEVKNFVKQAVHVISRIEEHPEMYAPSLKGNNVRKAPVNKHITLYYRFRSVQNEVILLSFWHNKQNPVKLKY